MSYRDDLSQAHERIAQLEGELREERAKNAPNAGAAHPPAPARPDLATIVLSAGIAVVLIVGIVFFMRLRSTPETIGVKPANEVASDPAEYRNRFMRVEGTLVPGTTSKRGSPCEMSMTIEHEGVPLGVHLAHCILPDAFRPDAKIPIVAEGELRADGVFEAKQILVRAKL